MDRSLNIRHTARFCLAAGGMDFGNGMYVVAVPYLALAMGADSMQLGLLSALRGALYALICLPAALLADRYSRRMWITLAAVGVSVAFAAHGFADSFRQVLLLSMLWGASLAFYWPSVFGWLGDSHSPEQLGPASAAVNVSWSAGGMFGGLAAGWLFTQWPAATFVVAAFAALAGGAALMRFRCAHGHPSAPTRTPRQPGTRRGLASAWLGDMGGTCLLGLMMGVFPKLGEEIGVDAVRFGILAGVMGVMRTIVFLVGIRWNRLLQGWVFGVVAQLAAAALVASVAFTSSHAWFMVVFAGVGFTLAVNYHRGLFKSLENPGSRSLKSGVHEAFLLFGIFLGSLGGGAMATYGNLRAPYVPAALFCVAVVIAQVLCVRSSERAGATAVHEPTAEPNGA